MYIIQQQQVKKQFLVHFGSFQSKASLTGTPPWEVGEFDLRFWEQLLALFEGRCRLADGGEKVLRATIAARVVLFNHTDVCLNLLALAAKTQTSLVFARLLAALALNLNRSLVFLIKSFFIVLSSRERTKAPGTEFCSRMKLCSWVRRHHSVASFLPLLY